MSFDISNQLQHFGIAQVMVVLKQPFPKVSKSQLGELQKHFTWAKTSHGAQLSASLSQDKKGAVKPPPPMKYFRNLGVALGTVEKDGYRWLKKQKDTLIMGAPMITLIKPERVDAARPRRKVTWGIEQLGVPDLWQQGLTGKGVLVGHLDTGVDSKHPALKKAIEAFAEFDMLGNQVSPAPEPHDSGDHGTHTAGTIVGRQVKPGKVREYSFGVAPGAKLASAMVIEGGDVLRRVLGGMDWAVGQGVRILNMSLGFPGYWSEFQPIVDVLRSRGILPVFAVGNEGPGTSRSPGNYVKPVSVGAVDKDGKVAYFSSSQLFQRKDEPIVPDLVGPGVDVLSAMPDNQYARMDGTSMATPHISGLAALLWEAKPEATVDELEAAIFGSCRRGKQLKERVNRGLPNAIRALQALTDAAAT